MSHFNTELGWPQTRAQVDKASDAELFNFMGCCDVEPADFDGCLACYAYQVVCEREEAERETKLKVPTPELWELELEIRDLKAEIARRHKDFNAIRAELDSIQYWHGGFNVEQTKSAIKNIRNIVG